MSYSISWKPMTAKSGFRGSEMGGTVSSLDLLRQASLRLPHSDAPQLDARWILAHVLNLDHRDPKLRAECSLTADQAQQFMELTDRRASGEPLAYILGEWEFFGYTLEVNSAVLVPRPETELLVEWALELLKGKRNPRIVEVGVGSAALMIALAHQRPDLTAIAVDLSVPALEVAKRNLQRHQLLDRIELVQGHLLEPIAGRHDLIISNPPYIVEGDPRLSADVARYQPKAALIDNLDGDGIGFHRALIDHFPEYSTATGSLLLECGEGQVPAIQRYASECGRRSSSRNDLAGIPRAVHVELDSAG